MLTILAIAYQLHVHLSIPFDNCKYRKEKFAVFDSVHNAAYLFLFTDPQTHSPVVVKREIANLFLY